MSGYTKGPWKARKVGGAGFAGQVGYAIDFNDDQEQVVDFVYEEAGAHLIAAAPDLLEALERLVSAARDVDSGYMNWAIASADSAIARARGEA